MMNDGKQQSTFLFHDYETFGTHPALDRPAQFAAIRTDSEFNVIGEPEVFYCKPAVRTPTSSKNYKTNINKYELRICKSCRRRTACTGSGLFL